MRSCDFRLDDWDSHGEEANTEALNGPASDESGKTRGEDLDECAEEVDEAA